MRDVLKEAEAWRKTTTDEQGKDIMRGMILHLIVANNKISFFIGLLEAHDIEGYQKMVKETRARIKRGEESYAVDENMVNANYKNSLKDGA